MSPCIVYVTAWCAGCPSVLFVFQLGVLDVPLYCLCSAWCAGCPAVLQLSPALRHNGAGRGPVTAASPPQPSTPQ